MLLRADVVECLVLGRLVLRLGKRLGGRFKAEITNQKTIKITI